LIFHVVFGAQWDVSGSIARALSITVALQFFASPLSQTLIVFERTFLQLAWDIGRLLTAVLTVVVCHAVGLSLLPTIWVLSLSSAVAYAVSWDLSRRTVARPPARHAVE
jgi:O-antigen/teichoic acid export membrane protein